jgi:gliding motility-associated-like protein
MLKNYTLVLFLFLSGLCASAQTFRWSRGATSNNDVQSRRTATDRHGNSFVTGYFKGTAQFGSLSVSSTTANATDIFLVKYDSTGTPLWARKAGGAGTDYGYGIAVDSGGNAFITGQYGSTATFGTLTIDAVGGNDAFIAKYNSSGTVQWVNRIAGTSEEYGYGVDVDRFGNIYATGFFNGNCTFSTQSGSSSYLPGVTLNRSEVYIARYNNSGVLLWVRGFGGSNTDVGYDIVPDDSGNAYVTGTYQNNISFGSASLSTAGFTVSGYIVKYNSAGVFQWAQNGPESNNYAYCYAIACDGEGGLYTTGYFNGNIKFGSLNLASSGKNLAFIARFTTNGVFQWAEALNPPGNNVTWGHDIAADGSGNAFLTGTLHSSTASGANICGANIPGSAAGGWGYNAILVKYNILGTCQWLIRGTSANGPGGWGYGQGVSVNDKGTITISGYNSSNFEFVINNGSTKYGYIGSKGSFIARFEDSELLTIPDLKKVTYCPSDTIFVQYSATGTFSPTNEFKVEISDRNGIFSTPVYIGKATSAVSGTIAAIIPGNLPAGNGYRIRVISSSPMLRSNKSTPDLRINAPTAVAGNDTILCTGDSLMLDGSASLADSFLWSSDYSFPDSASAIVMVKPAASSKYILKTSNLQACAAYDTILVTIVNRVVPDAGTDALLCIGDSVQLQASGGIRYRWSPVTGLSDPLTAKPNVLPGSSTLYTVYVSNGVCEEMDTVMLTLREPLQLSGSGNQTICRGQEITISAAGSGGDSTRYDFAWDNGLGAGGQKKVSPLVTTTYRVILTDSCTVLSDTAFITVFVRAPLQLNPMADTSICQDETISLYASGIGGDSSAYFFSWDNAGNGTSVQVKPDSTTTYRVVLSDNCTSEADTAWVTVHVSEGYDLKVSADSTICKGQSRQLSAEEAGGIKPGLTFTWDQGLGAGMHKSVSPDSTTTYRVILEGGCKDESDTGYVTVFVRQGLQVYQRPDTILCKGDAAFIFAEGSGGDSLQYTFTWDNGIGNGPQFWMSPSVTTTYRVILTDNCSSPDTAYTTLFVRTPLRINALPDTTICFGRSIALFTDSSANDSLAYAFTWYDGATSSKNPVVSPQVLTSYMSVLKDNCTLKTDTFYATISVRDPLTVDAGADKLICYGEAVTLEALATGGDTAARVLSWDNGLGTGNNFTVTPLVNTTYRVIISDGCTPLNDTDEVTLSVRLPLKVDASPDSAYLCKGKELQLSATGQGGHAVQYVYTWNNGLGGGSNKLLFPQQSTEYIVELSDGCSFPAFDTVKVTIEPSPVAEFSASAAEGCEPLKITFTNKSTFPAGSQMKWDFGNGTTSTLGSPEYSYTKNGLFSVSLLIVSQAGCRDSMVKTGSVLVHPSPSAKFIAQPRVAPVDAPHITFKNISAGLADYHWEFGDGITHETGVRTAITHTYPDTGIYAVKLVSTNSFGCSAVMHDTVRIKDIFRFFVPNSFTPNGDFLNDEFHPTSTHTVTYETTVFNRWGETVFYSVNGIPWNGQYRNSGDPLQGGTYLYQYRILDKDGSTHFVSGTVELLR